MSIYTEEGWVIINRNGLLWSKRHFTQSTDAIKHYEQITVNVKWDDSPEGVNIKKPN